MSDRMIRVVPYPHPAYEELEREILRLKKEFQEFKAVVEEREKLEERFRKRELTYITIIISLAATVIGLLCELLHLI